MRMTKDKKLLMLGVPATRNSWLWDCLNQEIIQDIDILSELFVVETKDLTHIGDTKRKIWPPHIANITISNRCKLPRESYEKIAVVRDPWERYIGLYEFLKKTPNHHMHRASLNWDFSTFIINLSQGNCTFDMVPQIHWLFDKHGRIDIDFLFKFHETTAIKSFFTERGYKFEDIQLLSKPKNVEEFYTPQTAKIVSHMCWFETQFFGFKHPFS